MYLNFELGRKYNSPVNLRFDDTNPSEENKTFIDSIKKDIKFLGFSWDKECYASDYFDKLYELSIKLIKNDKAYVDNQSKKEIKNQRKNPFELGVESKNRKRSVDENLFLFEKMKNGFFQEGDCVLRAKINMNSPNMNMRDPIMYRIILKKLHFRTKNKWCIYPTYDWTHGQCDYFEQITHSLCSSEFENKRPLYNWFINQIHNKNEKKIKPKQIEFSRINIKNTLTSKRKIQYLIKKKFIHSWDDPRLFTISGLKNRGYTPKSLKNFIKEVGITKRNNIINLSLLEFWIRKHLNKISQRIMVVLNPIKLIITNYPEKNTEWLKAENNPEDPSYGYRKIPFSKNIYIESEDFLEKKTKNFFRLYIGNKVRLKNAYVIKANYIKKNSSGKIEKIFCTFYPKKNENKIKSTLHWVSINHSVPIRINLYNNLIKTNNPNEINEKNISKYINKESKKSIIGYSEPFIKNAKIGKRFQFQRIGYFYTDKNMIFNQTISIKNSWKKKN